MPIVQGRDVLFKSQAGTGKTTMLLIAALQNLDLQDTTVRPQVMILTPSREVAFRTQKELAALGSQLSFKSFTFSYDRSFKDQADELRLDGCEVIIGTPGRLHDLIRRKVLAVDNLRMFCMDEADDMLEKGFGDTIDEIMKVVPHDAQKVVLYSAMHPANGYEFYKSFMKEPVTIVLRGSI
jgi:translation initiation factor 4A